MSGSTHSRLTSHVGWMLGARSWANLAPAALRRAELAVTAVIVCAFLSGCGFHMVGRQPLPAPLKNTYVVATDQQSDFVQGLRKALIMNGAQLVNTSERASGTVRVTTDQVSRKILSVSANNIPREYEITYTVEFSVSSGDKELMAAQRVEVTRDYSFNERTMLAKENEEAVLREGMARDLVGIVMRRLSTL